MFPLPSAQTCEVGLPSEARIPRIRDTLVQSSVGQARTQFVPSHPSVGQRDQYQSQGAAQAPSSIQISQRGQGMGRGRGQSSQAVTSRTQGHVYAVVPWTKLVDQSDVQGTFRLSHFLTIMLFKFGCIIFMLIVA